MDAKGSEEGRSREERVMMTLMRNECGLLKTKHLSKRVISQILSEKLVSKLEEDSGERGEIYLYIL